MLKDSSSYYAVIFSSLRSQSHEPEYERAAERMLELAKIQPGFLGVESVRGADGQGITVSYWKDLDSIQNWKRNQEHQGAQKIGKESWYKQYKVRICKVEREYGGTL